MNSGFHQKITQPRFLTISNDKFFFPCKYHFIKTSLSADSFFSFTSSTNKIIFCEKIVIYWLIKEDKCAEIHFDSSESIIDGMVNSAEWKRKSFHVNLPQLHKWFRRMRRRIIQSQVNWETFCQNNVKWWKERVK